MEEEEDDEEEEEELERRMGERAVGPSKHVLPLLAAQQKKCIHGNREIMQEEPLALAWRGK